MITKDRHEHNFSKHTRKFSKSKDIWALFHLLEQDGQTGRFVRKIPLFKKNYYPANCFDR